MMLDDLIKVLHDIRDHHGGNLRVQDISGNDIETVETKDNPFDEDAAPTVVIKATEDIYG